MIKRFKQFLFKEEKSQSEVRRVKNKQEFDDERRALDNERTKQQQRDELERARDTDFENSKKERDKKTKDSLDAQRAKHVAATEESVEAPKPIPHKVLEIGTDEIVSAYKEKVPGQ